MKNLYNSIKQKLTTKKKEQSKGILSSKISIKNERIKNELEDLKFNPIISIGLSVGLINEENIFEWRITLIGAADTLYELNLYFLKINFPKNYPDLPPKIIFLTPIYHPLVNPKKSKKYELGYIFDIFDGINWKKTTLRNELTNLYTLFYISNPNKINYEETSFITKEMIENKELYEEKVKYFSKKYSSYSMNYVDLNIKDKWDFSYNEIEKNNNIININNDSENNNENDKDNKENIDKLEHDNKKIILNFKQYGKNLEIECYEDELIGDVIKIYCDEFNIVDKDYYFIFNSKKLNYNTTIKMSGMSSHPEISVIYIKKFNFLKKN